MQGTARPPLCKLGQARGSHTVSTPTDPTPGGTRHQVMGLKRTVLKPAGKVSVCVFSVSAVGTSLTEAVKCTLPPGGGSSSDQPASLAPVKETNCTRAWSAPSLPLPWPAGAWPAS